MTQEEKAQRYDEAIERAKKHCADYVVETIFPELKKSDDEKIRKELVDCIQYMNANYCIPSRYTRKQYDTWIAWLEKQGDKEPMTDSFEKELAEICNQLLSELDAEWMDNEILECIGTSQWLKLCDDTAKRYKDGLLQLVKQGDHAKFRDSIQVGDKVTRNQDGVLVNLSQLKRVAKKDEKQGEQKPADKVEPKFKVGDKIISTISNIPYYITKVCNGHYLTDVGCIIMFNAQDNFELVEQKPAWSEENELHIKELESLVKQVWAIGEHENDKDTIHKMSELSFFLKTLKPQPKQEWSEDDERHENTIIRAIHGAGNITPIDGELAEKWLKDRVQPQPQWKPSDEQMKVLKILVDTSKGFDHSKILESLYQDLKKLREE